MGWNNPRVSWRELEQRLSWNVTRLPPGPERERRARPRAPGPGRPRNPAGPETGPPGAELPWAELHCHSSYSFLDGASSPAELVAEATRLGLAALAVTDHDGMYGVAQFAQAAAGSVLGTVFGAELSLDGTPDGPERAGSPDPGGRHLLVLARDPEGYKRLSAVISAAQLAGGGKGRPAYDLDTLGQAHDGHWVLLTGCRKGAVPAALAADGPAAALAELRGLTAMFGRGNVRAELTFHDQPGDDERNDLLAGLADAAGVGVVATGNVHYAAPARARLAETLAAIRARRSLAEMDGWLPATGAAYLRSGAEMSHRLRRFPGVQQRTVELALDCAFSFGDLAPTSRCPPGTARRPGCGRWLRRRPRNGTGRRRPSGSAGPTGRSSTSWR
jgi:error-prone DNA polymerase